MMSNRPEPDATTAAGAGKDPAGPAGAWPAAGIAAAWQRELPGVRTESIEIITPLWQIAKILADDRRRTLARLQIDSSTLDLLSVIKRAGPPYQLTTREITRRTLVTAGAVSQRVTRAEQAGLVERAPSSASRRAVSVRLTPAGHQLIEATVSRLLDHEADLLTTLTATERATLTETLAKLLQALSSRLTEPAHLSKHSPSNSGGSGAVSFCHGQWPVSSTSSEMLRKVRIKTMMARTATSVRVGWVATVRTMSPATSNSRPSRMVRPRS